MSFKPTCGSERGKDVATETKDRLQGQRGNNKAGTKQGGPTTASGSRGNSRGEIEARHVKAKPEAAQWVGRCLSHPARPTTYKRNASRAACAGPQRASLAKRSDNDTMVLGQVHQGGGVMLALKHGRDE